MPARYPYRRRRRRNPFVAPPGSYSPGYPPVAPEPRTPTVVDHGTWAPFLATADAAVARTTRDVDEVWAGGTPRRAAYLARHGWPEGAAHVRNVVLPMVRTVIDDNVRADAWTWDVVGASYDVGEYLSGVPECWQTRTPTHDRPMVRLVVNTAVSAIVSQAAITGRGGAVAALAMVLEAAGFVVEVAVIDGRQPLSDGRDVWQRVVVTDPQGAAMDLDRVLYALAHPSMPRQLFAITSARALGASAPQGHVPHAHFEPPAEWLPAPGLYLAAVKASQHDVAWDKPDAVRAWVEEQFVRLAGVVST